MEENKANQATLEHRVKIDWKELLPVLGFRRYRDNFNHAKERGFVGFGGYSARNLANFGQGKSNYSLGPTTIGYFVYQALGAGAIVVQ